MRRRRALPAGAELCLDGLPGDATVVAASGDMCSCGCLVRTFCLGRSQRTKLVGGDLEEMSPVDTPKLGKVY